MCPYDIAGTWPSNCFNSVALSGSECEVKDVDVVRVILLLAALW